MRKRDPRWLLMLALLAASCRSSPASAPAPAAKGTLASGDDGSVAASSGWKVKAHRGASFAAPENTLTAVKLGFEQGARATEIDVRLAADGTVVVFHDEDTRRIGNRAKLVREQTLAELRELDIGAWKGQAFVGERIATLDQVLAIVPVDATLFVEIKDGAVAVPAVLQVIGDSGKQNAVAIESFHPEVLAAVRQQAPSIPLHLTVSAERDADKRAIPLELTIVERAKSLGATGLAVDVAGLTEAFAAAAQRAGLELGVWTINEIERAKALESLPITWLETDRPELFAASR